MPKNANNFMINCLSKEDKEYLRTVIDILIDKYPNMEWSNLYYSIVYTVRMKLAQRMTDDTLSELSNDLAD